MKTDIETRNDVVTLVDSFYDVIRKNDILGYIFNDVAKVDWEAHLPKMYSFWASLLLGEHSYSGDPMTIHVKLSKITTMTEVEFSEWLSVFNNTVDSLFEGRNATDAKVRAANIARLMMFKIQSA